MHNTQESGTDAVYEIRVQGVLDARWAEWFNGMALTVEETDDGSRITKLTGSLDHSALHGILTRIRDLHLRLMSVAMIQQGEAYTDSQQGGR